MRSSIRDSPAVAHLPRALAEAAHPRSPASALDPESLLEELTRGGRRLRALPLARRLEAWRTAVARLLDEASPARRELEAPLAEAVRLSPQGLSAGLRAVASGMLDASADVLFLSAARRRGAARERGAPERGSKPRREPALVVLASNLPGLALQTVLPALACGRPLIVRSSEREPWFAPALMRELTVAEPELGEAFAALTWEHGGALEDALLARCDPVLAYGGGAALAAMRARVRGRFVEYGPKLSLGIVGDAVTDEEIERLARDVALFDQRGCLSVQVVFSRAPLERVAAGLARGLDRQADLLPPGPATFEEHAALRRELDLARLRGCEVVAARAGAVVVEPRPVRIEPAPGRRLVRLYAISSTAELTARLAPVAGSLQGAALAGIRAHQVEPILRDLGVSRIALAGRLQETDARWQNGGLDPLEVL